MQCVHFHFLLLQLSESIYSLCPELTYQNIHKTPHHITISHLDISHVILHNMASCIDFHVPRLLTPLVQLHLHVSSFLLALHNHQVNYTLYEYVMHCSNYYLFLSTKQFHLHHIRYYYFPIYRASYFLQLFQLYLHLQQ